MTEAKKPGFIEQKVRDAMPGLDDAQIAEMMRKTQGEVIADGGPLARNSGSEDVDAARRAVAEDIFEKSVAREDLNPWDIKDSSGYRHDGDDLSKVVFTEGGEALHFGVSFAPGGCDVTEITGAFDPTGWWESMNGPAEEPAGP